MDNLLMYDLMPSFSTRNSPSYAQDSSQFFDVRVSRSLFTSYYTDVKDTFCLHRFTSVRGRFPKDTDFFTRYRSSLRGHNDDCLGIRATVWA